MSTPQPVQDITTAKVVRAGDAQSVALLANGSVVFWGKRPIDFDYSSSTATYTTVAVPTPISGLPTAIDVVLSPDLDDSTCALINDGTVRCWGFTATGAHQANFLSSPTDLGLIGVTGISAGRGFDCAALSVGGAKCWGFGNEGELGSSANSAGVPVSTGVVGNVSKIRSGDAFSCVLLTSGTVQCWGANGSHQLGPNGGSAFSSAMPLSVTPLVSVKDLSGGADNACAVNTSGGVSCWGDDTYAQLADGNQNPGSGAPVGAQGLAGPASSVAVGTDNACAVLDNGSVQCWGRSIGALSTAVTVTPATVW